MIVALSPLDTNNTFNGAHKMEIPFSHDNKPNGNSFQIANYLVKVTHKISATITSNANSNKQNG